MEIERLTDNAIIPSYQSLGAAGLDLHADIPREYTIPIGGHRKINTGIAIHIDNPNMVGKIYTRSGNGCKHGIVLSNGTGVIDSDYQGEIIIYLHNRGHKFFSINPGDRIAQILFEYVSRIVFTRVDQFTKKSRRGDAGFGSTGS